MRRQDLRHGVCLREGCCQCRFVISPFVALLLVSHTTNWCLVLILCVSALRAGNGHRCLMELTQRRRYVSTRWFYVVCDRLIVECTDERRVSLV